MLHEAESGCGTRRFGKQGRPPSLPRPRRTHQAGAEASIERSAGQKKGRNGAHPFGCRPGNTDGKRIVLLNKRHQAEPHMQAKVCGKQAGVRSPVPCAQVNVTHVRRCCNLFLLVSAHAQTNLALQETGGNPKCPFCTSTVAAYFLSTCTTNP